MAQLIKEFVLLSMMHINGISPRQIVHQEHLVLLLMPLIKFLNYDQLCSTSQDFENMAMVEKKNHFLLNVTFCHIWNKTASL